MQVPDIHLDAISFSSAPTQSQLINTLRDISKFLNRLGASVILEGMYTAGDPAIGETLNVGTKLRQCADLLENGPSASGLAVPQAMPVSRVVR